MLAPTLSLLTMAMLFFINQGHFATLPEDDGQHQSSQEGGNMQNSNPLTSHILDTSRGRPAANVNVKLYKSQGSNGNGVDNWTLIAEQRTNADGRVGNMITNEQFQAGIYKLFFDTKSYFNERNEKTFYPYVDVIFEIVNPNEHYHVPILLNAYGFSTYRGS